MTPEKAKEMNIERAIEIGHTQAFPLSANGITHQGLSIREYMATQIMSAMITQGIASSHAAPLAVEATDKLLIELNETEC